MIASSKIVVIGATALGAAAITGDQITQIVTAATVLIFGVMSRMQARKAEGKLVEIHTLVNSAMGTQLRINAGLARRVSDLTQDAADKSIALEAEKMAKAHEEKQVASDVEKQAELDAAINKVKAEHAAKG